MILAACGAVVEGARNLALFVAVSIALAWVFAELVIGTVRSLRTEG